MPTSRCLRSASSMARSSMPRNSSGLIRPSARAARASNTSFGRRRLPTWSDRYSIFRQFYNQKRLGKFFVQNFGCRATQADGAALESLLAAKGLDRASARTDADLVVLNTCTITAAADDDV